MSIQSDDPEGYAEIVTIPAIIEWLIAQAGREQATLEEEDHLLLQELATGIASRPEVLDAILFKCGGSLLLDDSRYTDRFVR